jgi:hypothetical protein
MGDVVRKVMQFLVPTTIDALSRDDLTERTIVPVHINPQSFSIQEAKIINENLTKGGYIIQYWGEELPVIQASGTTGSGGIEAVNILRDVYRHEQIQFKSLLSARAEDLAALARESLNDTSTSTAQAGLTNVLDTITDGGFSGIVDGVTSTIEAVTDAALGISENNPQRVELIPSLAAFAVSIDLFWQGEKFRGYFKSFNVDETADRPGHFDYNFVFNVTRRTGTRTNFMPWHRNPRDISGEPTTASTPKEGVRADELSFPTTQEFLSSTVSSTILQDQAAVPAIDDGVQVPINRNQSTQG